MSTVYHSSTVLWCLFVFIVFIVFANTVVVKMLQALLVQMDTAICPTLSQEDTRIASVVETGVRPTPPGGETGPKKKKQRSLRKRKKR